MKTWFLCCFTRKWFHTILYHFNQNKKIFIHENDDLAMQGAKSKAAMVLTKFWNIPLSAPKRMPDQYGQHFADDNFKCHCLIFLNKIPLVFFCFFPEGAIEHWFIQWLGTEYVTSHNLNQLKRSSVILYDVAIGHNELTLVMLKLL